MYQLSGHVAEILDEKNRKWNEIIQEFFFDSLGMKNSDFIHKVANFENFAKPGNRSKNGSWGPFDLGLMANLTGNSVAAAASICSGSADFLPYLAFLLKRNSTTEEKMKKEAIKEAWEPSNFLPEQDPGASYAMFEPMFKIDSIGPIYGMGWFSGVYRDWRYVGHSGSLGGYLSSMQIFPDAKVGLFVSTTNSIADESYDYSPLFVNWLSDYILGVDPWLSIEDACSKFPEAWFSNAPRLPPINFQYDCDNFRHIQIKDFVGNFEHPLFGTFSVTWDGSNLRWTLGYYGRGKLCNSNPDLYPNMRLDHFVMNFDWDTIMGEFNDPTLNFYTGALVIFERSGGAPRAPIDSALVAMIEASNPPKFFRKSDGPQTQRV